MQIKTQCTPRMCNTKPSPHCPDARTSASFQVPQLVKCFVSPATAFARVWGIAVISAYGYQYWCVITTVVETATHIYNEIIINTEGPHRRKCLPLMTSHPLAETTSD